jgi:hypothetical protein
VLDEGTLRAKAMNSIKENVDAAHYTQAITLITRYSKRGFLRPELVLDNKIKEKMAKGKTKEQAIEELYNETTDRRYSNFFNNSFVILKILFL